MNGYFILIVALTISAVAGYYSIVGLAMLFAAAQIPVIIMGATLEVAKLVTASWLYTNWKKIPILMKTYFTFAVFILMFITSMGIFGFLSRAHIEQTGSASQFVANIEQINDEISRIDISVERKEAEILKLSNQESSQFDLIQNQINAEQANIDLVYNRIQPDIDRLQNIIDDAKNEKISAEENLKLLDSYITANDVNRIQALVGVRVDGNLGPATRSAMDLYKSKAESDISRLNSLIIENEAKIVDLRTSLEPLVKQSTDLITQLRSRISTTETVDVSGDIEKAEIEISELQEKKSSLIEEKFDIENTLRKIEAEVGPIKYIAELAYGSSDKEIIDEAVRWVIIIIIVVFDPLAVLLVIAANMTIREQKRQIRVEDKNVTRSETVSEYSYDVDIPEKNDISIHEEEQIPAGTRNIKYYDMLSKGLTFLKK
jgi:hypothetical protein